MIDEFLWVEIYRPKTLDDCILPDKISKAFHQYVRDRNVPNLILSGGSGSGKTSSARALLSDIDCDSIIINGSLYGTIGTLRNEIKEYASTVSLTGGRKYVILDEADYLNQQSMQPALRNFMEEYSSGCGFILTCNYPNRILPALHSRCSLVNFTFEKEERPRAAFKFIERAKKILEAERIEYDDSAVAEFIIKHFPDFRKALNELQAYSACGKIDVGILSQRSVDSFNELTESIKRKDYSKVTQWVVDNKDIDFPTLCRDFYKTSKDKFLPEDVPKIVLTLADYQYKDAFVADKEINMLAMMTEIMVSIGTYK